MPKGKSFKVNLIPDVDAAPGRVYSNMAYINHNDFEFTINFCEFIAPLDHEVDKEGDEITRVIPIKARIAIPIHVIPLLINALKVDYNNYLEERKIKPEGEE